MRDLIAPGPAPRRYGGPVSEGQIESPEWLLQATVLVVAGKGGVGSSTVAAAAALAAAGRGADVLFISVDGRPGMGPLMGGREINDREQTLERFDNGGKIRGRTIPADQAFGDYLELKGVGGLLRKAASSASLPMIAAATPGLEHLLVLGKIKELEKAGNADLIVVDAPGAFELVALARALAMRTDMDAVVCLGCVLTGETTHDRYICDAVAHGFAEITARTGKPVAFGVLTCQTIEQAEARAGGAKGNKGAEAMSAALVAARAVARIHRLPPGRPA